MEDALHRLSRMVVSAATTALVLSGMSARSQEAFSWKAEIEKSARELGFRGVILMQRHGHLILNEGFGEAGEPFNSHTRYWIASISKSFTATLIFRLEEQGALKRSDTLPKFFPTIPPDKRAITVEELLTHTSGLPNKYASEGIADSDKAARSILELPLSQTPGQAFGYTNDGYSLLGLIAEIAGKAPYSELLQREIFEPAGMSGSGLWPACPGPLPVLGLSEKLPESMNRENWGYKGPDGICSTTADLARWMNALLGARILRADTLQAMWRGEVETSDGYATPGWFASTTPRGSKIIWTRGTDHGHNSIVKYYPDKELLVISLSSSQDPEGPLLARILVNRVEQTLGW